MLKTPLICLAACSCVAASSGQTQVPRLRFGLIPVTHTCNSHCARRMCSWNKNNGSYCPRGESCQYVAGHVLPLPVHANGRGAGFGVNRARGIPSAMHAPVRAGPGAGTGGANFGGRGGAHGAAAAATVQAPELQLQEAIDPAAVAAVGCVERVRATCALAGIGNADRGHTSPAALAAAIYAIRSGDAFQASVYADAVLQHLPLS